jgi:6,7-dimethyl-8-ribityllumazine synthase
MEQWNNVITMLHQQNHNNSVKGVNQGWRIGIVHSSYYKEEIGNLRKGAEEVLVEAGIQPNNIKNYEAAGSFEIPLIGAALAKSGEVDALIALGIIVEGATHHAELLAREIARGIMDVQIQYRMPFAFEVLYVTDLNQARERTQGDANRGAEGARAVLHSLAELERIRF